MTTRRKLIGYAMAVPWLAGLPGPGTASTTLVQRTKGYALQGYDPVGYFYQGRPVNGKNDHVVKWIGALWRFASAENMMIFEANPHGFAPQYGGYCAYNMSRGVAIKSVPDAWTIDRGKLYLNYSLGIRAHWRKNQSEYIARADIRWADILHR